MRQYLWQQAHWPGLTVDETALGPELDQAAFSAGTVAGLLVALGLEERSRVRFDALADTAIETSAIEGEVLDVDSVRASLARRLALPFAPQTARRDDRAEGVVAVTLDAVQQADRPLTEARLHRWHSLLFPEAPRGLTVAAWRLSSDDPMQVVSKAASIRPVVHFEAPPAARVDDEMTRFLGWFEAPDGPQRPLVRAALAHLWFLTIHPYGDGNGRVGRAIADLALARADRDVAQYVSLSAQIRAERKSYYNAIESAQRGPLDVTPWVSWFVNCYGRAIAHTNETIRDMMRAHSFWREHPNAQINARQRIVLERYLAGGFQGWINTHKYATIAKTSPDTAQRDIAALAAQGILIPTGARGPRTSYRLTGDYDPNVRSAVDDAAQTIGAGAPTARTRRPRRGP
ncbi:MAG: Fic family protein [Candidatus Eremiobacteraeota bacterium]|nr:Fic family protein [Candidatus Eremiobacteraeota bacterium]